VVSGDGREEEEKGTHSKRQCSFYSFKNLPSKSTNSFGFSACTIGESADQHAVEE
jgi:hypothetical protein